MNIQQIPLDQLRLSPRNVRKTGGTDIDDLMASIAAEGVLNNLVVTATDDGLYFVEDGGRRLRALQQMVETGRLPATLQEVPCKIVASDNAVEAGLSANIIRMAMHPADEFVAFKRLADEGSSTAEIAKRFGKTTRYIDQRLQLANVRPELFELYRNGQMNLEQLMSLAGTNNHELQRQAWETARSDGERSPTHLREFITRESVRNDQALPIFVGVDAYQTAGGRVRSDLFSDHAYLLDLPLLDSLALDKLDAIAVQLRADGWAWAEAHLALSHSERCAYPSHKRAYSAQGESVHPTPEDEARWSVVDRRLDEIQDIDADTLTSEEYELIAEEQEALEAEREALEDRMVPTYPADVKAESGVLVYLDAGGALCHSWARLPRNSADDGDSVSGEESKQPAPNKAPKPAELSDTLRTALSAHRSAAAAVQLAKDPTLAQCVLLERLLISHWPNAYGDNGLHLGFNRESGHFASNADLHKALRDALLDRMAIFKVVPRKGTLEFLLKQTAEWRLELQAALVVAHFDGTTANANGHGGVDALHRITGFDMADHWTPTVDDFIGRLHKDLVIEAVAEAKGKAEAATLISLKKDNRTATAAKLLAGTGWLPKLLRGTDYGKKKAAVPAGEAPAKAKKPAAKKATKKPAAKKAVQKPAKKVAVKKRAKAGA